MGLARPRSGLVQRLASKFRFKFIERRQASLKLVREGLKETVLGHADGLAHVAQGVLDNEPVLTALAQDDADAGLVAGVAQQVVNAVR